MTTLADLQQAVTTTLASKRLGRPVFVRCHLTSRDKAEAAPARLTQLVAMVRDWIGQPLAQLYAVGKPAGGQVALTIEFREGATALVCWSHGQPLGHGLDL